VLRYQAGAEVFSFYSRPQARDNLVVMGAEVHDLTDTQDGWPLSEEENSVDAPLFHRDFRDYFRRAGAGSPTPSSSGRGAFKGARRISSGT
jgi:hypothetical protein